MTAALCVSLAANAAGTASNPPAANTPNVQLPAEG
jgi:hypothetical protein